MLRTTSIRIEHYDCPSEEQIIRMHLEGREGISGLSFDLASRCVSITHELTPEKLIVLLEPLSLGTVSITSDIPTTGDATRDSDQNDKRLLWIVLIINFSCFLLEIITGILSSSMGLAADALDMLADAAVYGMSIYAVGHSMTRKKLIAKLSGYIQLTLAATGLFEVVRRFVFHVPLPDATVMILISIIALIGNTASLLILRQSGNKQVHFRASIIFTSNDIIANAGVILAALFVFFFQSGIPDLIIGTFVFILVTRGALSILSLSKR